MTTREKRRLDYKLRVHTVPEDMRLPLAPDRAHLANASAAYHVAVESRLLWDVWMIDQYGALWIAIAFENQRGEPEFHTMRIDPGTYRKVRCDPHEAAVEIAMPIKSKAQRRKFAELLVKGEISPETFEEWNRAAGGAELPERLHPKVRVKAKRKARSKRAPKSKTARAKKRSRPRRKRG
jgi:hypothetical protein